MSGPSSLVARMRRWRFERKLAAPRLLRAFADAHASVTFLEIGSNDGEQHDHLRPLILERGWRGVMVEPVPYIFHRLERNYEGVEGVALANVAIGDRDGASPFYYLVDAPAEERHELPSWYDGIGSFSRDAVTSHAVHIPDIEDRIVAADVLTLTFDSLCEQHGLEQVDLVLIDTEGHDWAIIRTIDLERWRPQLLIYEHYHLGPDERSACAEHLQANGYDTMEEGFDTFCLSKAADARLRERWRRLHPAVSGLAKYEEVR